MAEWAEARARARELHRELRTEAGTDALLPGADLLARVTERTGLTVTPVATQDPLLGRANALLDRNLETVYLDTNLPESRRLFVLAHEFAHFFLHPEIETDFAPIEEVEDALFTFAPTPTLQIAEGYSPRERREAEANAFAVELLLPSDLLRRTVRERGGNAGEFAARIGISESLVRAQMAQALLLPEPKPVAAKSETVYKLDPSQERAAFTRTGPTLVDAGPGTGKTRTLVSRLLFLLQEQNVPPENILALTFTNKAAEEMRTRLRQAVGTLAERVWIGTFHALGYEILRKEAAHAGLPTDPPLLDTAGAVTLLEQHFDRLGLAEFLYLNDRILPFPDILRCLSRAKDELRLPEDYRLAAETQLREAMDEKALLAARKSQEIARVYTLYSQILDANGLLDFGDLILRPVQLLTENADVRRRWQAQYPHILADEYQDVNRATARLLQLLAGAGKGLWAVGDLRQAIYRFRGASPANLGAFEQDFPDGVRMALDRNYRSLPPIVHLFDAMAHGAERDILPQTWTPTRTAAAESVITLAVPEDEIAQADGLAAQIRGWQEAGVPLREQAILCRTNRQAGEIAGLLTERGVPTRHLSGLFDREEIKDLLALLALTCEINGATLPRLAKFPEYGIPSAEVRRLASLKPIEDVPFVETLRRSLPEIPLSAQGKAGVETLLSHLEKAGKGRDVWTFLTRYLFDTSRYLTPLLVRDDIAAQQALLAVRQLLQFAQGWGRRVQLDGGDARKAFLAHIRHLRLCGEERAAGGAEGLDELDGVPILTMHAAKGLEYAVVYLPNLIEGQFPSRKPPAMAKMPSLWEESGEEGVALDDDEALFFVALSRARDHLVLSRPALWRGKTTKPSPYLKGIEPLLPKVGAQTVTWNRQSALPLPEPIPPPSDTPPVQVSLSAVEQYRECPRQYYYMRVERLTGQEEDESYRRFYACLEEAVRFVETGHAAGKTPTESEAQDVLAELWEKSGPEPESPAFQSLYRTAAFLLANAQRTFAERPPSSATSASAKLVAELPNGAITLQADRLETLPDGSVKITRRYRRGPKADDHTNERLALLRQAAKAQSPAGKVEIELQYLADGSTRPVPEKAGYEAKRVEKYDQALAGIRNSEFPASPEERRCARCPYFLLCPKGV